jgi:hypothetical protein
MFADSFYQACVGDGRPYAAGAYDADLSLPLAHWGETSTQQTNIKRLVGMRNEGDDGDGEQKARG